MVEGQLRDSILKKIQKHNDDRDNQLDITSDGPDSTTSGSDIPEGHYDRPPEE